MHSSRTVTDERFAAFLVLIVLAAGQCAAGEQTPPSIDRLEEQAFKEAAALVNPSIVRIQTVGGLDRVGRMLTGTGPTTGLIVSSDGDIVSSVFNFISKPASVLVTLGDGRRFPARVVANDYVKKLTLLKIDAADLTTPPVAPKASFRVGQWAIALGRTYDNSFPSISVGIVSALNRVWGKAIQTDAKVSPVNYGGPLVDIEGRVMGVLVPLSPNADTETAGVEWYDSGIGFAVPLQDILASLDRLKKGEDLRPGLMGIVIDGRDLYATEPIVGRIRANSPAQKSGLKPGDRIVQMNGIPITRLAHLRHVLGTGYAGDRLRLAVKRGVDDMRVDLTLVAELDRYESAFLGILPVRQDTGIDDIAGVATRYIYPHSPAATAGLKVGDRIVRVQDTAVPDSNALLQLVSRLAPGDDTELTFLRDSVETTVAVKLASLPDAVPPELRSAAIPDSKRDAEKQETAPTGRFTRTANNSDRSYWAYIPEDYHPDHTYALAVWIHPLGDTMEAALYDAWKSICDRRGIILLAPKQTAERGWTAGDVPVVKALVEEFQQKYTIASDRVCLHSYSGGGAFAYYLAFKCRDLFRGAAITSATFTLPLPDNDPQWRQQFYVFCGSRDPLHPKVKATVERLRQSKFPTCFATGDGTAHEYPSASTVEEIGRWIDTLDQI